MGLDRSKVVAQPVDVYLMKATDTTANVADFLGGVLEDGVKFNSEPFSTILAGGIPIQNGNTAKLEIESVETDTTKLQHVEGLLLGTSGVGDADGLVNVYLVPRGTAVGSAVTGYKFLGYGGTVAHNGPFEQKKPNTLKLVLQKYVGKPSDAMTVASITVSA